MRCEGGQRRETYIFKRGTQIKNIELQHLDPGLEFLQLHISATRRSEHWTQSHPMHILSSLRAPNPSLRIREASQRKKFLKEPLKASQRLKGGGQKDKEEGFSWQKEQIAKKWKCPL